MNKDNKSHILKHLHSTTVCFDSCNSLTFKISDKANSKFDLKTKESLHINYRKPNSAIQQYFHTFTVACITPLFLSVFVSCLSLLFIHLLLLTLTIDVFYCLNQTSLLLQLIIIHLVNIFYNKYHCVKSFRIFPHSD